MIGQPRHLHDDHLYECYLADRFGQTIDPPAAEHLADCETCAARYAGFAAWLDSVRDEGASETDQIFTAERLHQQQDQILRRIEHLHHPARVISFPQRVDRHIASPTRVAPRWLAAAAAAGLFVGVAVGGMFLEPRLSRRAASMQVASAPAASRVAPRPAVLVSNPAPDAIDDDAFLMELEFALERPRTRELQPFDALTPLVQDVESRVR